MLSTLQQEHQQVSMVYPIMPNGLPETGHIVNSDNYSKLCNNSIHPSILIMIQLLHIKKKFFIPLNSTILGEDIEIYSQYSTSYLNILIVLTSTHYTYHPYYD